MLLEGLYYLSWQRALTDVSGASESSLCPQWCWQKYYFYANESGILKYSTLSQRCSINSRKVDFILQEDTTITCIHIYTKQLAWRLISGYISLLISQLLSRKGRLLAAGFLAEGWWRSQAVPWVLCRFRSGLTTFIDCVNTGRRRDPWTHWLVGQSLEGHL